MSPPDASPIRVLLADDHPVVLWGLERVIGATLPHMSVVGACSDPSLVAATARDTRADVVLLDLDFGSSSGIGLIPSIRSACAARVLALTGVGDPQILCDAIVAGASGVANKSQPAESLLRAIRGVAAGELWIERGLIARLIARIAPPDKPAEWATGAAAALTLRERDIVVTIASNSTLPLKVIADRLEISEHTLRNHLTTIYGKLGVGNRLGLFEFAHRHALVREES
jgi:two-component system, NarL family, nitrate/nitrite response regulator NarL